MATVMLGVDPAKRSHAMAVVDRDEVELAALRVGNDTAGYRQLRRPARRRPDRTWAVVGAGGVGARPARRLVADAEAVPDVPPKPATRARIFAVGRAPEDRSG